MNNSSQYATYEFNIDRNSTGNDAQNDQVASNSDIIVSEPLYVRIDHFVEIVDNIQSNVNLV